MSLEMIRRLVYNIDFKSMSQLLDSRNPLNTSDAVCAVCSPCVNESISAESAHTSTATGVDWTKQSTLIGCFLGAAFSCLIYFVWRRTDAMHSARQTSYPVSQNEIEQGDSEVRPNVTSMVYS